MLATALVASPFVMAAAPASADTPGCVTHGEFNRVQTGWKQSRVHQLFDTAGTAAPGGYRYYAVCGEEGGTGHYALGYQRQSGVLRFTGDKYYDTTPY